MPFDLDPLFPDGLDLNDAFELLWPAALYLLGMVIYAIFIFKFYRFVAARDMFEVDLSKYEESRFQLIRGFLHCVMYVVKYVLVFPLFAIFWFTVLTLILAFLSKEQAFPQVLLAALATVSAIRVASYYNEDLSRDLAKILPFAVLGIFIIDASFFEVSSSLNVLEQANGYRESILYYLVFLVGLEFILRLLMGLFMAFAAIVRRLRAEKEYEGLGEDEFDGDQEDEASIVEEASMEEEAGTTPAPLVPGLPSVQPSPGD